MVYVSSVSIVVYDKIIWPGQEVYLPPPEIRDLHTELQAGQRIYVRSYVATYTVQAAGLLKALSQRLLAGFYFGVATITFFALPLPSFDGGCAAASEGHCSRQLPQQMVEELLQVNSALHDTQNIFTSRGYLQRMETRIVLMITLISTLMSTSIKYGSFLHAVAMEAAF